MKRLTVDKPANKMNMMELAYNCMYAKDGWARYRDFEQDMDLRDYIREYNTAVGGDSLPENLEELEDELMYNLQYDVDDIAGQVAFTYRLMWALADMREALKAYEDTGLTPEEIMDGKILTGWIPVEEKLPSDEVYVLVTCQPKKGARRVNRAYCSAGCWHGSGSISGVIAWMPLPEPYKSQN